MSIVCLYFPRHICNCYSKNALWFLLPCQTALWYWLHVKNNLPVLLVQNNLIFQLLLYALLKAWSISVFVLIWLCKHDRVIKVDTDFEICLWTLSLPSDLIVITFVFSLSLEWHFICNLLDLFHLHLHNKKAASLLINTEHCVCNHCHGHEKTPPKNSFQIQMWQMASLVSVNTRGEPDTCKSLIFSFVFCVCVINSH